MAQLYKEEFSKQEKAKEEHIKQAKEKAIELQRVEEENRKKAEQEAEQVRREQLEAKHETERIERERQEASKRAAESASSSQTGQRERQDTNASRTTGTGIIGNSWAEVSPEQAAQYMASKTGVSASKWLDIIYKESSGNPYVTNYLGCYGLLQIMQSVHGQVSNLSPQAYLDKAVEIYRSSGGTAWETW